MSNYVAEEQRKVPDPNDYVLTRRGVTLTTPKKLYKFLKADHAQKMLDLGSVRLGTLYEFRQTELYSGNTLDAWEGVLLHQEKVVTSSGAQLSPIGRTYIGGDPEALAGLSLNNCDFVVPFTEPDQYIYCCSLSPEWNDVDPAYDVCVEIVHVTAFICVLTEIMRDNGLTPYGVQPGEVRYKDRVETVVNNNGMLTGEADDLRPAFRKPERFSAQQEYRLTWVPATNIVVPLVLSIRQIAKFCRRYSSRS